MPSVFACFEGTTEDTISISVEQEDFLILRRDVLLGFVLGAKAGSGFDPARVEIGGDGARTVYSRNDLSENDSSSLTLARLSYGDYQLQVRGEDATQGDYDLDVFLPGDLDGNGTVTSSDLLGIVRIVRNSLAGNGEYVLEADGNLDGRITTLDLVIAVNNFRNSTTIQTLPPLNLEATPPPAVSPDGSLFTNDPDLSLAGDTLPGLDVRGDTDGDEDYGEGSTMSADDGSFQFDLTLTEGLNPLAVRVSDSFGQTEYGYVEVTLDTSSPDAPVLKLATESDTPPVGDNKTTKSVVTLVGNTSAGATVTLGDDLFILKETVADANGHFEFHDVSLQPGENDFTTTATDVAGNRSSFTATVTRLQDDTTPPVISITAPPHGSFVVERSTFDLSVTASDDKGVTTVDIFLDGQFVASDSTDPYAFTITVPPLDDLGGDPSIDIKAIAFDAQGNSASDTITLNVIADNKLPVGVDDTDSELEGGLGVSGNVLSNDDHGDAPTTVTRVTQAAREIVIGSAQQTGAGGSITFEANGSYTYVPPGFDLVPPQGLIETFIYDFRDSDGDTAWATLMIFVSNFNRLPIAIDDLFSTVEGGAASVHNVLNGDVLGDAPTAVISVSQNQTDIPSGTPYDTGAGGSITVNQDGTIKYEPPRQGAVGVDGAVDTFTYTIQDSDGDTDTATVTIAVANNNLIPDAVDDSFTAIEGEEQRILDLFVNDMLGDEPTNVFRAYYDGNELPLNTPFDLPSGDWLSLSSLGRLNYTPPDQGVVEPEGQTVLFTYTIEDSAGATPNNPDTDTATVTITVENNNLLPMPHHDENSAVEGGATVMGDVLVNDELGDEPTTVISVQFIDGTTSTSTKYVSFEPGESFVTPAGGAMSLMSNGTYAYTPPSSGVPADGLIEQFLYRIEDTDGDSSSSAFINIHVAAANLLPMAENDSFLAVEAGPAEVFDLFTNDQLGSLPTTLTGATQGGKPITLGTPYSTHAGGIIVYYETGTLTYDPAGQGAVPPSGLFDVFEYTITDLDGDSDTATVTITVANNNLVPLARPDMITVTAGGGEVTGNVRANDDLGDPPTQVTRAEENGTLISLGQVVTTANGGTFSIGRFGLYSYTPPDSVPAGGLIEEIKYVIRDSDGEISFSDLKITVLDGGVA